jgi:hypothetical protein
MSWKVTARALATAEKRRQRQEQKRLRDLERRAKEQARLSALEQARLEVELYESQLEVLLSVHKEQGEPPDWRAIAASLPPSEPRRQRHRELRGRQNEILASVGLPSFAQPVRVGAAEGRLQDEREFQEASQTYLAVKAEWEEDVALAGRILAGDQAAFLEALTESPVLPDISAVWANARFSIHDTRLVDCAIKVKGTEVIPREAKALSASGKLSVKAMPKGRLHEIFQDYVCGCVLRVAREVLGLLPVEAVLVTASVDVLDTATGHVTERPVLSMAASRVALNGVDLDHADPSDAMDSFIHRGDVKASRKTGAFAAIEPLTADDVPHPSMVAATLSETLARGRCVREELVALRVTLGARVKSSPVAHRPL